MRNDVKELGRPRVGWIDGARGIGIVLVVYGHALRGQVSAGTIPQAWHASTQDYAIYSFHMPLFFILSGMTFARTAEMNFQNFFKDRLTTLIYPYLLWSTLSWAMSFAFSSKVNNALTVGDLLNIWQTPILQYWFIYVLAIVSSIGYFLWPRWKLLSLSAAICAIFFAELQGLVGKVEFFFVFFFLGMLFDKWVRESAPTLSPRLLVTVAAVSAILFTFLLQVPETGEAFSYRAVREVTALTGSVVVIALCMLAGDRIPGWLKLLGQASMAIYVMHTIVTAAVRLVVTSALGANAYAQFLCLALSTLAGLAIPTFACIAASRAGISSAVGFGRALPRWRRTRAMTPDPT